MSKHVVILNECYVYRVNVEAESEKEALERGRLAFMYASETAQDYFVDSHTTLCAVNTEERDEDEG